jgi:xylan 1,4-beta-xylosidase
MDSAEQFGEHVKNDAEIASAGGRMIPVFLDEYGIDYTWNSGETRQYTNVGAVWDAVVLRSLAYAGATHAMSWAFKDGVYGMVDMHDTLRPAATVYGWGTRFLTGDLVAAKSNAPGVEAMAVRQSSGSRSVLLINRSDTPARVSLDAALSASRKSAVVLEALGATGIASSTVPGNAMPKPLALPAYSLLLVRTAPR